MILCIDIGNSTTKAALYIEGEDPRFFHPFDLVQCKELFDQDPPKVLVSKTGLDQPLEDFLRMQGAWHVLDHTFPLNIDLDYDTPETLGSDRLAVAVAAQAYYPDRVKLIVDLGTCLTVDVVDANGVYRGGVISPGLEMRLRAMHQFTAALPKVPEDRQIRFPGKSTMSSMQLGAFRAIQHEIKGFAQECAAQFGQPIIIDCSRPKIDFDMGSNFEIFAHPKLVLEGLKIVGQQDG